MSDTNWRKQWADKLKAPGPALSVVKPGNRVFVGSACGTPQLLVRTLSELPVEDVEVVHILTQGVAPYSEAGRESRFRTNAFFISANVREAVWAGRADYTPIFLSEIPRLFKKRRMPLDVALIQVTPPDEHGYCSLGVSVDITKAAAETADIVIAEVNPRMARTLGDSFIHLDHIHMLVENDDPIQEFVTPGPSELASRIAKNVASLIEDGSTLQIGYGGIPNALLTYLKDKKDLGVHTEVFSDGIIDLIEQKIINNHKKTLHPGKVVAAFAMGTRRLYDFIDNNPMFAFYPVDYTNDPFVIAQNDKMVSINSALEVDFTGQVCADSFGYRFYSGIGGQLDFVRGSARSRDGKPIIVLPSTRANGTISRIVPHLGEGGGVVTSRGDVHYVVTEWGAADLHGKSIRERTLALISIAHPKFRSDLLRLAKQQHYVYQDQPEDSLIEHLYPEELEDWGTAKDGTRLFLRPVRPTDEARMRDLFYAYSKETVYFRFFSYLNAMPHDKLKHFVNVDYDKEMAVVAILPRAGDDELVGTASYVVDQSTGLAEFAISVAEHWQNRGVGSVLLGYLIKIAKIKGVRGFVGYVLDSNTRMYRLIHKMGYRVESKWEDSVYTLTFRFDREAK
ncbi:MAG: GNAT family N-acetyltransferase [candidate division WOR-3 bacterium]